MIVDQCPHCGTKHINVNPTSSCQDAKQNELWLVVQCQNPACLRMFLLLFDREQKNMQFQFPAGKFDLPNDQNIPAGVHKEFREAGTCLAMGCYLSSMTMSRRVLQRCLKDKGHNDKNLAGQIDAAKTSGLIPDRYHVIADEIRHYGNIGAHPDDDAAILVNVDNAKLLLEFVKMLIHEFYELPAIATSMTAKRLAAKA